MGEQHCGLEDEFATQLRIAGCYEQAAAIRKARRLNQKAAAAW
jgi:hypothetical protein